jgi:hypothetical protein
MLKDDLLSILMVAGVVAGLKIVTMSNISWWVCVGITIGYILLLIVDRRVKRNTKDTSV